MFVRAAVTVWLAEKYFFRQKYVVAHHSLMMEEGGGSYVIRCGRPETAVKIQQRGLEDFSSTSLKLFLPVPSYRVYFLGKHSHGAAFGTENTNVRSFEPDRGTAC